MLPHVFSHQQQYPSAEQNWQHQQHLSQHLSHHPQSQHQAQQQAAAAAQAAQQQHYSRIAAQQAGGNPNGTSLGQGGGAGAGTDDRHGSASAQGGGQLGFSDGMGPEERRILEWMSQLLRSESRESALLELSKKREQFPQLALILWHSFGESTSKDSIKSYHSQTLSRADTYFATGVMTSLLQEIISVYPLLNPSQLTAAASNRVCNALALLQCVASHNETRSLFLSGTLAAMTDIYSTTLMICSAHPPVPLSFSKHDIQISTLRVPPSDISRRYRGTR